MNVDDWRTGKGGDGNSVAIPFEGDYDEVVSLIDSLQNQ